MRDRAGRKQVYRLPLSYILRFILAVLLGKRRDLGRDARGTLMTARPRPKVLDDRHVPSEGPFVFVANHYERPGLRVWWGGMLAATAIYERRQRERTLRWLMTSEWYNFRLGGVVPVPTWALRWLFRRIANVYGLVIVPRSPERGVGRAAAMRSILEVVERQGEAIGLYPEGLGREVLIEAMPGTGLFLNSLSRRGVPLLPCGVYEEEGVLTARFGRPFFIDVPRAAAKEERDRLAREQVMARIGRLLPRPMWGPYAAAVEQLLARGSVA
jgi:1-acyl-sn-glycerol-3-phosphate acyltransferase